MPESLALSANTTKTRTAPAIEADSGRPITRWKVESVRRRSSAGGCGGGAPGGGGAIFGAAPPFVSSVRCASLGGSGSGGRGLRLIRLTSFLLRPPRGFAPALQV